MKHKVAVLRGADGMKEDGSIALFQYWNRLRDGRAAPGKTEIEPADIKGLLADTFILEKDSRGQALFRLAGTRLCATYGRELKGFSFISLWQEKDQRLIARLVHDVFTSKSVVVITCIGASRCGREAAFEFLLLPLDGGHSHPRCLGVASPGTRPYWLGADPVLETRIDSVRVIDPDREPLFLKNRAAVSTPPLAPRSSSLAGGENGRRVRHLVVLAGGRKV
jgi:hypothetical protein